MDPSYILDLARNFNRENRIPIYVEEVAQNHPERRFHAHTFTELTLILRGEARHIVGSTTAAIKRGDLLVLYPGSTHAYDKTRDFALINLIYDDKKLAMPVLDGYEMPLFQRFFPAAETQFSEEEQGTPAAAVPEEKIDDFACAIRDLQKELDDVRPGNFFFSLTRFMQIMAELARSSNLTGKRHWHMSKVSEIVFAMQKKPMTPANVEEMAKNAMMSKRSFFRAFQALTGCSPQEYRMQLRLKMATDLLISTRLSIGEIAFQCGFYDSNYFCHLFRRHFQTSPREYRKHRVPAVPENVSLHQTTAEDSQFF